MEIWDYGHGFPAITARLDKLRFGEVAEEPIYEGPLFYTVVMRLDPALVAKQEPSPSYDLPRRVRPDVEAVFHDADSSLLLKHLPDFSRPGCRHAGVDERRECRLEDYARGAAARSRQGGDSRRTCADLQGCEQAFARRHVGCELFAGHDAGGTPDCSNSSLWVMTLIDSARAGVDALPAILTLRLLPFTAWAVISRAVHWPVRLVAVVAYGCIVWLAQGAGTPLEWLVLLYLYGLGAGWAAFELSSAVRSRLAWFSVVLLLFWGLPVIVIRPIPTTFLLICWDFMLKAYSFRMDTRGKDPGTLGDFLFFLLVSPVLVYRDRGSRVAPGSFHAGGGLRIALGLVATILSVGPLSWFYGSAQVYAPMSPGSELIVGASRLCKEYAAHSGIASIQNRSHASARVRHSRALPLSAFRPISGGILAPLEHLRRPVGEALCVHAPRPSAVALDATGSSLFLAIDWRRDRPHVCGHRSTPRSHLRRRKQQSDSVRDRVVQRSRPRRGWLGGSVFAAEPLATRLMARANPVHRMCRLCGGTFVVTPFADQKAQFAPLAQAVKAADGLQVLSPRRDADCVIGPAIELVVQSNG